MSKKKTTLQLVASGTAGGEGGGPSPQSGITCHNFIEIGKAFMYAQDNSGFVIAREAGHDYPVTLREWGAWMAWRKSKNLSRKFADKQGYYTVPARWPHLFDADWPEHRSVDAANRYQEKNP